MQQQNHQRLTFSEILLNKTKNSDSSQFLNSVKNFQCFGIQNLSSQLIASTQYSQPDQHIGSFIESKCLKSTQKTKQDKSTINLQSISNLQNHKQAHQSSKNTVQASIGTKTIQQLKKQLKKKQQRKKKLTTKIKNTVNQLYMPILEFENPKQIIQNWTELALIGINQKNNTSIKKHRQYSKNNLSNYASSEIFKTITKNYYEARYFYEDLILKNVKNKSFVKQFIQKTSLPQSKSKLQNYKSEEFIQEHNQKWQAIKLQEQQRTSIESSFKKKNTPYPKRNLIKQDPSPQKLQQPMKQNSSRSLLRRSKLIQNSSLISESPSILNKINLPTFQKVRQSIFGDLKKTMNVLMDQNTKSPTDELPMILKRYRAISSKQEQIRFLTSSKQQFHEQLKQGRSNSISQRQHVKNQRFKTQNNNYLNAKTQILNLKRKKYVLNNIQLGDDIYQSHQNTLSIDTIRQESGQEHYMQSMNHKINPHKQISEFSSQFQKRKIHRLAFIDELRQHLKLSTFPKKSHLLTELSQRDQQKIKSPKIVDINPQKLLGQYSQRSGDKFIPSNSKIWKDKYFKLKKQSSFRNKMFKKEKRSFSLENPQQIKYFPILC